MFPRNRTTRAFGGHSKPVWRVIALAVLAFALPRDAFARTTPLGNATQGTSNSGGGSNGVVSPSGPGVHPGYTLVSFRNAIASNWRFGGLDWLSDGRIVAVLWGQDCSYTNSSCGSSSNSRTYYGDIGQAPDGGGPGSMHFISDTEGMGGITGGNVQEVYSGLWEPLGLQVARSGNPLTDTIFVMTKTGVLRFIGVGPYTNGVNPVKVINTCYARTCADSIAPGVHRSFTTHAPVNYANSADTSGTGRRWHHFNYGLVRGDDGYYYAGTGTQWDNFNISYTQGRDRCAVLKMDLSTVPGTVENVAGGLRSPNGWGKGPGGDIFFTEVEGEYNSVNSIYHYQPGRYYGMRCDTRHPFGHTQGIAEALPTVSLNQGGASNTDIANNPGELAYITSGTYAGQMLYGDVTFGGIQRVFLEKVNDEWQGAVFLFSGGFRSGVGRLRLGADGSIYAGGQSGGPSPASGNWCWGGAGGVGALTADRIGNNCNVQYDFFKLVPKDTVVFELLSVRARSGGFELEFTKKVGPSAGNPSNYTVQHWVNNLGVQSYGSGKQSGGVQDATVSEVLIHADSMRVFLKLASMPPASVQPSQNPPITGSGNVRVVMIKGTGVLAADGSAPWGEPTTAGAAPSRIAAWYTLNHHATDSAFTPVAPVDPALSSPAARYRDLRVHAGRGTLVLEMNFAQPARITLRDLKGRAALAASASAGRRVVRLGTAGLASGRYLVEVRVGGNTFARAVVLN